ncbi:hypothetical protein G6F35_003933 [Rhizopus arrhizus]|nr:hypothetical protein G6F35_003933 [Rhizopus arrhizus]
MNYIKKTNLELALRERKTALRDDFDRLLKNLPEGMSKEDIKWDDFLWAYSVYSSRAFPYKLVNTISEDNSEVLFPLVDALNHKPNTKITWSRSGDSDTGSISFISGQEYQAGNEIFNNYGPKSNEELLTGYGFCFEYNEYDHIALKPNFSQDLNYATKLSILRNCGVSSGNADEFTFYIHRNNIPPTFFKLMRVLVMNSMETAYYANCNDSKFLDMVGYRNELSTLSMILALLKNRLLTLKSVTLDASDNIPPWQKYSLMYRSGQEDIYNITIAKVEEMKRQLINCMDQDIKENRIAPFAPFLSIVNPEHQYLSLEIDNNPFISLDMVVITLDSILKKNDVFSEAISETFENVEEEADIMLMLCLINEKHNRNSKWLNFFEKVSQRDITANQDHHELRELYDSMMPEFAEAYPDVFNLEKFDFQSFIWADNLLNNYSIDNPLAIVPL